MLIDNQTMWQIGTGDNTRDYTDICLDYSIAIVGPGIPGNAKENPDWEKNHWGTYLLEIKIRYSFIEKGANCNKGSWNCYSRLSIFRESV